MIDIVWDESTGITQCIITDNSNGITFQGIGAAYCHHNDKDFQSQKTGEFIAQTRAEINIMQKKRDYDLKPGLMALKHLQATMNHSNNYNNHSYEAKRLRREIQNRQEEILQINEAIKDLRQMLKQYIDTKEEVYQNRRKGNIQ